MTNLLQAGGERSMIKTLKQTINRYNLFTSYVWMCLIMLAVASYFIIGGIFALNQLHKAQKEIRIIYGSVPFTPYDPF